MAGPIKVANSNYLFREGDASDALYVVKSGKFAVTKSKGNSEVLLAEIGPGSMVGEMAFFDNRPRSANVRALKDSEVIALPFKSLHAQFQNFPEWCKAIMRTVNNNLRDANARLKLLEKSQSETDLFPPHTITKMMTIINLVGFRYGKKEEEGLLIPFNTLRNHTIQLFQEPTHKMDKLINCFGELKFMKLEELGEGKKRLVHYKPDLFFEFVDWYNDWLFKAEKDRIQIEEEELRVMRAVLLFGAKTPPDDKGFTRLNLTDMQNESMKELGDLIKIDDVNSLIEKKLIGDKLMQENVLFCKFKMEELQKITPYWEIIYGIKKLTR
jgi:CRP/FNR family cyclic AMP-dependent transcriptional regulator